VYGRGCPSGLVDLPGIRLFGKRYVLAMEKANRDAGSPGEYENQVSVMQPQFNEPVVLVVPRLF